MIIPQRNKMHYPSSLLFMTWFFICSFLLPLLGNHHPSSLLSVYSLHLRSEQQPFLPSSSSSSLSKCHIINRSTIVSSIKRGGKSPIESNPNYIDYNQFMPPTIGNDDDNNYNHIRQPIQHHSNTYYNTKGYNNNNNSNNKQLKPLIQILQESMIQLSKTNATIFYIICSTIVIFILWQIPIQGLYNILRSHFVCNSNNILWNKRNNYKKKNGYSYYHTLLTAAISHNTLSHLLMNIYGFYIFGKKVNATLIMNQFPLWVYCIVSAIFSNIVFILLSPKGSSCIGLSGVTLSLLALDAKLHPTREIGFVIRFIPIRLPAQYALSGLLLWSIVGVLSTSNGMNHDGVAHSVHLGGLVFGIVVYELLKNGWYRNAVKFVNRMKYNFKHVPKLMKNKA